MKNKGELKDLKEFKRLLMEMYATSPNVFSSREFVSPVIRSPDVLKHLEDSKILYSYEGMNDMTNKKTKFYALGANGFSLISAWKTEELNKDVRRMTSSIVVLSAIIAMIGVMQLFFLITH
jgi:hypothetical protein